MKIFLYSSFDPWADNFSTGCFYHTNDHINCCPDRIDQPQSRRQRSGCFTNYGAPQAEPVVPP